MAQPRKTGRIPFDWVLGRAGLEGAHKMMIDKMTAVVHKMMFVACSTEACKEHLEAGLEAGRKTRLEVGREGMRIHGRDPVEAREETTQDPDQKGTLDHWTSTACYPEQN